MFEKNQTPILPSPKTKVPIFGHQGSETLLIYNILLRVSLLTQVSMAT